MWKPYGAWKARYLTLVEEKQKLLKIDDKKKFLQHGVSAHVRNFVAEENLN